jgi:hypothetical protein
MRSLPAAVSAYIYARLIPCYPPTIRAKFGDDMIDTFAETLENAWKGRSWKCFALASLGVTNDLRNIVLPYVATRAAPVLLAIVTSTIVYVTFLAMINPARHCHK